AHQETILRLAGLEALNFTRERPSGDAGGVRHVGPSVDLRLFHEEHVDVEAERLRLERDKVKIEQQLTQLDKQLGNESFLSRAPKDVVDNAKRRHAELSQQLRKVAESLERPRDGGRIISVNLRELARNNEPYFQFDREERHMAGILFHLLNHKDNAERVVHKAERNWEINLAEFGVYLDYSYPRDLWNKMGVKAESNNHKRDVILGMLGSYRFDTSRLASLKEVKEFNAFFIGPRASRKYIQSPANWSLTQIETSLRPQSSNSDRDLVTACKIKWAFKAKPDIVIHADRERALCIELKLESVEGSYPSEASEKKLLRERGLFAEGKVLQLPMSQTDLQKFLMTELLGLDCRFLFITRHKTSGTECVSWSDFLGLLEPLPNPPPYIAAALENAEHLLAP
ncbi:MAG: hypothetical protein DMG25_02470, partial [Acidobacteria bacterium]